MIKKQIYLFFFLFFILNFLIIFLSLSGCKKEFKIQSLNDEDKKIDDNIVAYKEFQKNYNLWKSLKIQSYHFTVNYIANSVTRGTWNIWVKDGKVIRIITNNNEKIEDKKLFEKSAFSSFTFDKLFEIASFSYKFRESNLFKITAKYDEKYGYPAQVKKIPLSIDAPKDLSFAYYVIAFDF